VRRVLFGLLAWGGFIACAQSQSGPPEPSLAKTSASPAQPAQKEPAWFERSQSGAWPKLELELRGAGAEEWSLSVDAPEHARREGRKLLCPERWEQRCWQATPQTGRVPPAALDEFFAVLGRSGDWQASGPPPPGQAQLVLKLERDGARSKPLIAAATTAGAEIRQAAQRLSASFVPDP